VVFAVVVGIGAPMAIRDLAQARPPTIEIATRTPRQVDHGDVAQRTQIAVSGPEAVVPLEVPTRGDQPTQAATVTDLPPARGERVLPPPSLRPDDSGWVARRLEIPALGVDVAVAVAGSSAEEDFPPHGGAYLLRSTSQPGRGTNSYLFAHAMPDLFKPLWWASSGQQVIVTMSDGQQLGYRITAVVRDIPCPDAAAPKPAGLPPVLANATECDVSWTLPTLTERLTLQTSQGFNRNYGEMVVLAEPEWAR
jgi:hypothetical protein